MKTNQWLALIGAGMIGTGQLTSACAVEPDVEAMKQAAVAAVHTAAAGLGSALKEVRDRDAQLRLIRDFIEPVRFLPDQSGYFYVYDFNCVNVAHATQKDLVGKNLFGHQDSRGQFDIQALCQAAKAGGGLVEYYWMKPGAKGEYRKLGYVEPIPGTEFFIGTGIYLPGDPPPPEILSQAAARLNASLQGLDQDMAALARRIAQLDPAAPEARDGMRQLGERYPFVLDVCFVSPAGVMTVVEPAAYRHFEGSDISSQLQVIEMHRTQKPILSQAFLSVEGIHGVDLAHPVPQGGGLTGSLSAFIRPDVLIGGIVAPLGQGSRSSMLVMQNDGTSLYDPDPEQLGKNLFTDPMYQSFPELIQLGRSVAAKQSGYGRYSFFAAGTREAVAKEAHWMTVSLHGIEWKLVCMTVAAK